MISLVLLSFFVCLQASTTMLPSLPHCSFFFFFLIVFVSVSVYGVFAFPSGNVPYVDHCSSVVPESTPTNNIEHYTLHGFTTPSVTGGDEIFRAKTSKNSYVHVGRQLLRFRVTYETNSQGVCKTEASLSITSPYQYNGSSGSSSRYGGSYYHWSSHGSRSIRFSLNGFWSGVSGKLCMVGSASIRPDEGGPLRHFDAVLKLSYASKNPSINTSVISGSLESTSLENDTGYFDPILVFNFPSFSNYSYSLVPKELDHGLSGDFGGSKDRFLSLGKSSFCSLFSRRWFYLELEYATDCKQHCSPVGNGLSPRSVLLNSIQCSKDEKKLRYLLEFDGVFSLDTSFVGEASWDDKNNELFIVACKILNPNNSISGRGAVGDCAMRLSLRYPSFLSVRNDAKIVGEIWTIKAGEDFKKINLTSWDENSVLDLPGLRYEYSELDRARKYCPEKHVKNNGNAYPDGRSYDMRFDVSVKNSKGERSSWGYAMPISVGNELFERYHLVSSAQEAATGVAVISEPERITTELAPLNISYKIVIEPWRYKGSMNLEVQRMEINAEGVYNPETGHLCMVGCRKIRNSTFAITDCEALVSFEFAPLNSGGSVNGTVKSRRVKTDPLYFQELSMSSAAPYITEAKQSIWRMDLEITMVVISNTLSCIFIALQLFHMKRNPEVLSCISFLMLIVLSLGLMVPLVLNFEALFVKSKYRYMFWQGWVEANEVAVRVVTMVAFLLQVRLLQLVWIAKSSDGSEKGSWTGEGKAGLLTTALYVLGGLIAFLSRNIFGHTTHSLLGHLKSYGGLVLDGFLLPQIVLNIFRGSPEKALSHPFYIGTSAIRLVPHAYDQYRAHSYPTPYVPGTNYYANPTADFYSTAWDIVIPCGIIALAVIVFLQQRRGGRSILPQRFRELELYEEVPTSLSNE